MRVLPSSDTVSFSQEWLGRGGYKYAISDSDVKCFVLDFSDNTSFINPCTTTVKAKSNPGNTASKSSSFIAVTGIDPPPEDRFVTSFFSFLRAAHT